MEVANFLLTLMRHFLAVPPLALGVIPPSLGAPLMARARLAKGPPSRLVATSC